MKLNSLLFTLIASCFYLYSCAQSSTPIRPDVLNYQVHLAPNFKEQQIEGKVTIQFKLPIQTDKVVFDAGNLSLTKLEGEHIQHYEQVGKRIIISLVNNNLPIYEVQIEYKGNPKRGLIFSPNSEELYTVYFTSEWMICNASPNDKATLQLHLLIPNHLTNIASGVLMDTNPKANNKTLYTWHQNYETPAYTYGFTIGDFNQFQELHNDVLLNYYAKDYTSLQLEKIFNTTGNMISFFEEKAGIPLPQKIYSQILIGNHYQEMSGFAILKNTYGEMTLKDSMEINLMAHELAHQWWGNRVTCKDWNHFWLNEGLATFMSAAYNEHCFGHKKYQQDIDAYFKVYARIKAKGKDKALVFTNWTSPTIDDRNLVYFKGAYVLHLLREELGNELFWKGIKYFTQKHFGKSVVTKDFQAAMEFSANRDLGDFFDIWVY